QTPTGTTLIDPGTRSGGVYALDFSGGSLSAGGYYTPYRFVESSNFRLRHSVGPVAGGQHRCSILKDGTPPPISGLTGTYARPSASGTFSVASGPPAGGFAKDMARSSDGRAILAQSSGGVSVSISPSNWQSFTPWNSGLDATDTYNAVTVGGASTALF